jgi:hypothetical protein
MFKDAKAYHTTVTATVVFDIQSRLVKHACFIDFREAYDLVLRDLLLQCVADMGVRDNFLSCLASMYWSTPMVVKNGPDRGPSVDSSIGVKQGDPLSPLLFGLFIDRVEAWLQERAPQWGAPHGRAASRPAIC